MIKNAGFFSQKVVDDELMKAKASTKTCCIQVYLLHLRSTLSDSSGGPGVSNWGEWRRQSLSGWQTVWLWPSEPISSSDPCDGGCSVVSRKVLIHSSFLLFVLRLFPQISALVVQNSCPPVHDWDQRSWGFWVRVSVFRFLSRLHQNLPTCMSVLPEAPLTSLCPVPTNSEKGTARLWLQPWFPCREMPVPCWCPQLQIPPSVSALLHTVWGHPRLILNLSTGYSVGGPQFNNLRQVFSEPAFLVYRGSVPKLIWSAYSVCVCVCKTTVGQRWMQKVVRNNSWSSHLKISPICFRAWDPTPVFLPGESPGQRSLGSCSPWGCKEWDTAGAV